MLNKLSAKGGHGVEDAGDDVKHQEMNTCCFQANTRDFHAANYYLKFRV